MEAADEVERSAVRHGGPPLMAEIVKPGAQQEGFDPAAGIGRILVERPANRSVPPAQAAERLRIALEKAAALAGSTSYSIVTATDPGPTSTPGASVGRGNAVIGERSGAILAGRRKRSARARLPRRQIAGNGERPAGADRFRRMAPAPASQRQTTEQRHLVDRQDPRLDPVGGR